MNRCTPFTRVRARHVAVKRHRRGMTLIEMLVATVVTLLLVFALSQAFAVVSATISLNRATLAMSGQLRGVALRMQRDVEGLTVPARPWPRAESGLGYLEYVEGPSNDVDADDNGTFDLQQWQTDPTVDTTLGDVDDVLAFTARSTDEPFVGQILGQLATINGRTRVIVDKSHPAYDTSKPEITTITSKVAEIIYWTQLVDRNANNALDLNLGERVRLHRKLLLVRPDLDLTYDPALPARTYDEYFNAYDVSAHYDGNASSWVANSLADLTKRENRYAHNPGAFPYPLDRSLLLAKDQKTWTIGGTDYRSDQLGEDVMLGNLTAFDVRVFDPLAPIGKDVDNLEAMTPADPGYGSSTSVIGYGAFVDLAYKVRLGLTTPDTFFSALPAAKSQLTSPPLPSPLALPAYDTWSYDYEFDGIDQDGVGGVDQGTNGYDDDGRNGVDDVEERETSPPYPLPLRGIQIRVRIIDPESRQVRQMTVVSDFTPE